MAIIRAMGRLKIDFGDAARAVSPSCIDHTAVQTAGGVRLRWLQLPSFLLPGRCPPAVRPRQLGGGRSDVGRADGSDPETVGRHRGPDVLRSITGVSAQ